MVRAILFCVDEWVERIDVIFTIALSKDRLSWSVINNFFIKGLMG